MDKTPFEKVCDAMNAVAFFLEQKLSGYAGKRVGFVVCVAVDGKAVSVSNMEPDSAKFMMIDILEQNYDKGSLKDKVRVH